MDKIFVFGFPHCGTTILKSIIGHIDDIEEIYSEVYDKNIINEFKIKKKFLLYKCPFTYNNYFSSQYDDHIKIFIIRNPIFVFSSLNKRYNYKIPSHESIEQYIETIKLFIYYKKNHLKNLYLIRYEDLFDNNFQNFKNILDNININYTDKIFNNIEYNNKSTNNNIVLTDEKPSNENHDVYRFWQINQPFVNNNNIQKIDLTEDQKNVIKNNEYILEIYPEINFFNI